VLRGLRLWKNHLSASAQRLKKSNRWCHFFIASLKNEREKAAMNQ
jgi:hypothetical protein